MIVLIHRTAKDGTKVVWDEQKKGWTKANETKFFEVNNMIIHHCQKIMLLM